MISFTSPTTSLVLLAIGSAYATTEAGKWPYQTFVTEPDFHPPIFDIEKNEEAIAEGLILFTPSTESRANIAAKELASAMIMTDDGELVWNGDTAKPQTNLFVQQLDGRPVLSHWRGTGSNTGHGYGSTTIVDDTYSAIYEICLQGDFVTSDGTSHDCYNDLHESFITDEGTILVTAVNATTANLTSVGGPPDGWIWDTMFYEIDVKTNETVFRWSPYEAGISFNQSKATFSSGDAGDGTKGTPWDWFHMNAVQRIGNKYLVNSRHTWSTYLLDSKGGIEWRIDGGDGGDFVLPFADLFRWQHHARGYNLTDSSVEIHWFNNNNTNWDNTTTTSGLKLSLDLKEKTATLLEVFEDPTDPIYTDSQGSFWPLPNGNTLIGYGSIPKIKEFGPDGNPRMTLTFGENDLVMSYRSYRQIWHATPHYPPKACGSDKVVYMSWNGATDVTDWVVYGGSSRESLSQLGKVAKDGFENSFNLESFAAYVRVEAYDGSKLLGKSDVVTGESC
ncbi:hypothetical protein N7468_009428 [Penicillium chermesinum]|uniref:ASST-domain-containing protein n=1 Tax=Penicillium chermesinum TaxID=63820 RepID=A0A9W9NK82_9EURO|nr:uncharacterized protein N7468_009428 [Penicillium chermesinum]KAJ5220224.1 hypothetical protein N7468_009428 [Penicillium chermesinum]KAJ6157669.1 hypothetical protein N7470_005261 [Penicillium chermesinum]